MKKQIMRSSLLLLSWLILAYSSVVFAQMGGRSPDEGFQGAEKCRLIRDNMQRLLCFDALFDTPLATMSSPESASQISSSQIMPVEVPRERPIGDMILAMERERAAGFEGWQVYIRRWQGGELAWSGAMDGINLSEAELTRNNSERNPVDIFMTMREAGVARDRAPSEQAILLLSCDNDITTLGVLLPQPINTLSANLSLSGPSGGQHRLNWRNVESGSLVIAGRGLESIETIKAIADYPRIQFQVTYPEGPRAFVFNMDGLKAKLRPFRIACHW